MKKFIVLFLLVTLPASVLLSQNYEIFDKQSGSWVKITNGATITRTCKASSGGIHEYFGVKNVADAARTVYLRKQHRTMTAETMNDFCWANTCYDPTVFVSHFSYTMQPGMFLESMFKVDFTPGTKTGDTRVTYSFFDRAHLADSAWFDILYITQTVGMDEPSGPAQSIFATPNPASNSVKFSGLENSPSGTLTIMNILGLKMAEISLEQTSRELSVEVSSWPNGIYLYYIASDNKKGIVSKLIVRH